MRSHTIVDVSIPGGAFGKVTGIGWKTNPKHTNWTYTNKSDTLPGAIDKVVIVDKSARTPGLVAFSAAGKKGLFGSGISLSLPLTLTVGFDPPLSVTGQCGQTAFALCEMKRGTVSCK